MNANIRKHYHKLTARERVAAMIAARLRDDESEMQALADSAPREVRESFRGAQLLHRFITLAMGVALDQFQQAADTLFLSVAEESDAVGIAAYLFLARAEAWRTLCKEYGIDGAALFGHLGCGGLETYELICRELAFAQEEAAESLKAHGHAGQLVTVDTLVSGWRKALTEASGTP